MSLGRIARACGAIALLLTFVVPVADAAGLVDSLKKVKQSVNDSFGQTAYYNSAAVQTAVGAPVQQMNTARQHLDQTRFAARAMFGPLPRVSINGNFVQPSGNATAQATSKGNEPTGGGASADPFERWGLFINGDFDRARQATVGNEPGFTTDTNSITIGADYRFEGNHVLGASVAFLKADADLFEGAGSQDTKGYGFTFFGSFVPTPNAYVDVILNIGHNNYDGVRLGNSQIFTSDTSGNQWGFAISGGYGFSNGGLTLTPYGRVEYVNAKIDGFVEGGGPDRLTVGDQRIKATTLALGGQASYAMSTSWGVLLPNARIEYQHLASSNYTNSLVGTTVPVQFLSQDKNYGIFAVGASGIFSGGLSAFFNYQQLFGKSDVRDRLYTIGLRMDF